LKFIYWAVPVVFLPVTYNERDAADIKAMLPDCDIGIVIELSNEVLHNPHRINKAKKIFIENFIKMAKECDIDVPDYVQQLDEFYRILQ